MEAAVGTSILDIGARKSVAMGPATEGMEGHHVPEMFGLPNVGNVSELNVVKAARVIV